MSGEPWTFDQLAGQRRKITLAGYSAPFGRPRQKPVITTGKELRESETRYPGSSGPPTRHIFGTRQEDFELEGRWMSKYIGQFGAEALVKSWEDMIEEGHPVRIMWGTLLSYTGIVKKLEVKWESKTEVAWKLTFKIDKNDFDYFNPTVFLRQSPTEAMDDVNTWLNEQLPEIPKSLPSLDALSGELFDTLDDLISNVTQFGGLAVKIAGTISDFETATFDELNRLRAGLHQFKTAVLTLQQTLDNIQIDSLLVDRQAADDIAWLSAKSSFDVGTSNVYAAIARSQLQAERAQRGRALSTYVGRTGDSWESISTLMYGGPSGADKIRQANGIRYGQSPVPGTSYLIPK